MKRPQAARRLRMKVTSATSRPTQLPMIPRARTMRTMRPVQGGRAQVEREHLPDPYECESTNSKRHHVPQRFQPCRIAREEHHVRDEVDCYRGVDQREDELGIFGQERSGVPSGPDVDRDEQRDVDQHRKHVARPAGAGPHPYWSFARCMTSLFRYRALSGRMARAASWQGPAS